MKKPPLEVKAKRVSEATEHKFAQAVIDLVSAVPPSSQEPSSDPNPRVREIARAAKRKAALASAGLALPPGPMGWLTVLPEIYAVWKIQAQMVADIAAIYGHEATLNREHMLYCLFRHTGAQLFRDLVMRVGERYLVRRVPIRSLYSIANKVGMKITQRSLGRAVSRVIPIAGALGVGAYTWYDTRQVARTTIDLFSHELATESAPSKSAPVKNVRPVKKAAPRKRAAKAPAAKKSAPRKAAKPGK
jgi:hypothetical protein